MCVCVCVCVSGRAITLIARRGARLLAHGTVARMRAATALRTTWAVGCRRHATTNRATTCRNNTTMRRRYGSPNHVKGDIERMRYVFVGDFVDRPSPPRPTQTHTHGSQRGAARRVRPRAPSRPLRSGASGCTADAAGSRAALLHDGWSHSGGRVRGCMRLAQPGGDHAAARTQGTDRGSNLQSSPSPPFPPAARVPGATDSEGVASWWPWSTSRWG